MNFLRRLQERTDLPFYDTVKGFDVRVTSYGVTVITRDKLLSVTSEQIAFSRLTVCGRNLELKSVSVGEVEICGEIEKVEKL